MAAGFEAVDVHMDDLIKNRLTLEDFQGAAACGELGGCFRCG